MIDKRYVFQAQAGPYLFRFLCIFLPFLMKSNLRHKDQRHRKCDAKRKRLIAHIRAGNQVFSLLIFNADTHISFRF